MALNGVPEQIGVVFDLDGVLVMTEHLWEEGWSYYSAQHGYAWSADDTRPCQGMSVPEWAAYLAARSSGDAADAARVVTDRVIESYLAGRVRLCEGALELAAAVASRVPTALASSAPREVIDTAMSGLGLGPYFSATVSSAEVARGKPSPDVYLEAIRRIGVDPQSSLAVEDSSNGIRAAAAAGLRVIAVAHEQYPLAPDAAALSVSIEPTLAAVSARVLSILDQPRRKVQR
jgi:HAD superfamily hydrolase (TIGR01509 family)